MAIFIYIYSYAILNYFCLNLVQQIFMFECRFTVIVTKVALHRIGVIVSCSIGVLMAWYIVFAYDQLNDTALSAGFYA